MKKLICLLLISICLFGCATKPTLDSFVEEMIESSETNVKLIESYNRIEYGDVSFGISLIEDEEYGNILYMSGLAIDEFSTFSSSYHGGHEPFYLYVDTEEFAWQGDAIVTVQPYLYMELEASPKMYYAGVEKGKDLEIKYEDEVVKTSESIIKLDEKVDVTLWMVEIDKESTFDLDKLEINKKGR